jgi:hypothetical protein
LTPIVSEFCELYIHTTPGTVTKTSTVTRTTTITPAQSTVLITTTTSATTLISEACTTTVTTSLTTLVNYPTVTPAAVGRRNEKRSAPNYLTEGCHPGSLPSLLSSACSCFLTSKTATSTHTSTKTVTAAAPPPKTTTTVVTTTLSASTCTTVATVYAYQNLACGIASPTAAGAVGQISCTAPAPAGETNGLLRVEGGSEGTIFEGCVSSGPREITTPSGGTHECDGTNGGANPNPGATILSQLDQAATNDGFTYDGTFDTSFDDFFITRISQTSETATEFWGTLEDWQFTPVSDCQVEISTNGVQESLWAFDAFNAVYFLRMTPEYQVVQAASALPVSVTVTDGSSGTPLTGATVVGGTPTDANGVTVITVPVTPGCYQYKATHASSIRSNAFYLTVLPGS